MNELIKPASRGLFVGRGPARDVAFTFRMGTGAAGQITRSHPMSSEPNFQDASLPVLAYGLAVVVNSAGTGVRQIQTSDTGITTIYGVAVRPFPTQQFKDSVGFGEVALGAGTPPGANNAIDVLKEGYILVPIVGTAKKGGTVYLWVAASSGAHVQGGFEASSSGSTVTLTNCTFNGVAGSDGIGELVMQSF